MKQLKLGVLVVLLFAGALSPSQARAGVFSYPHFVQPGKFAVGMEPELVFGDRVDVGINFRYTHGLNELNNLSGIVGTGGDYRRFRFGVGYTFDFFPDVDNQPGIGVALQTLYVKLPTVGSVEVSGIPYVHKSFKLDQGPIVEPFFAVPVGLSLADGTYQTTLAVVAGALFEHSEHLRTVAEFAVNLRNTYTTFSGGIVYYH